MITSDECRANALECERMAGIACNPVEKVAWVQMAEQWLRMIPKAKAHDAGKPEAAAPVPATHPTKV